MASHSHKFTEAREYAPARPEIAAFAATLNSASPFYWPALAASDGCDASLAELNGMLLADDCYPFVERSVVGMVAS